MSIVVLIPIASVSFGRLMDLPMVSQQDVGSSLYAHRVESLRLRKDREISNLKCLIHTNKILPARDQRPKHCHSEIRCGSCRGTYINGADDDNDIDLVHT